MNYEQLKNSILGEAICGRLVPQDPDDEPASVLLDRIAEEKGRLVKEKKIKADKNESRIYRTADGHWMERFADKKRPKVCIDDEIPFDIPEAWEWCRLGFLIDFGKGNSVKPELINDNDWILDLEDIEKGTGKVLNKKRMKDAASKSDKHSFSKGNVLYSKLRPYLNKVIIADEDGFCTSELLTFDFGEIYNKYAQAYLMSSFFVNYAMAGAYGVKMPRLGSDRGNKALFPLPPLSEQHRIVEKLEEILPKVEEYGKAQDRLDALNKALPEKLKASILQEAIEGRLVPQDPDDEPASVLLDRIAEEKGRLVKEKKIKADKNASRIYRTADGHWMERFADKHRPEACIDEEIPFDIPETWEVVRLGNIAQLNMGKTPERGNAAFWSAKDFPWVSIADMIPSGITRKTKEYVSKDAAEKCFKGGISKKGSLLMSFKLTIGRTTILGMDAYHNEAIITIIPHYDKDYYLRDYLFIFLPMLANQGDSKEAIKGKTLNSKSLYNILVPLPPLSEQHRIVEKLEEILPRVEALIKA